MLTYAGTTLFQEMQAALSGKRQQVDWLRAEADDLSKASYWPADRDRLTAQLTGLDDQCTGLDVKVCLYLSVCLSVTLHACCSWS